jgi:hypothetical protein
LIFSVNPTGGCQFASAAFTGELNALRSIPVGVVLSKDMPEGGQLDGGGITVPLMLSLRVAPCASEISPAGRFAASIPKVREDIWFAV